MIIVIFAFMNQSDKLTYLVPSCQTIRLEPRESIAQSSTLTMIMLMEITGSSVSNAAIDIEDLGYEGL